MVVSVQLFHFIYIKYIVYFCRCFMYEYLPSITVTGGNLLLPFIFTILIRMENYSNKNMELFFNLSRCIALKLASLMVALLSMKVKVLKPKWSCSKINIRFLIHKCCVSNRVQLINVIKQIWPKIDQAPAPAPVVTQKLLLYLHIYVTDGDSLHGQDH